MSLKPESFHWWIPNSVFTLWYCKVACAIDTVDWKTQDKFEGSWFDNIMKFRFFFYLMTWLSTTYKVLLSHIFVQCLSGRLSVRTIEFLVHKRDTRWQHRCTCSVYHWTWTLVAMPWAVLTFYNRALIWSTHLLIQHGCSTCNYMPRTDRCIHLSVFPTVHKAVILSVLLLNWLFEVGLHFLYHWIWVSVNKKLR